MIRPGQLVPSLERLAADESGQDLIEYAFIAALIGIASLAALSGLSTHVRNAFNSIGNSITGAV